MTTHVIRWSLDVLDSSLVLNISFDEFFRLICFNIVRVIVILGYCPYDLSLINFPVIIDVTPKAVRFQALLVRLRILILNFSSQSPFKCFIGMLTTKHSTILKLIFDGSSCSNLISLMICQFYLSRGKIHDFLLYISILVGNPPSMNMLGVSIR